MKWLINLFKGRKVDRQYAISIFTLGSLEVFGLQTAEEIKNRADHHTIYWGDLKSGYTYGPFSTVYEAMRHYSEASNSQHAPPSNEGQVIYVDFKNRRKLEFER